MHYPERPQPEGFDVLGRAGHEPVHLFSGGDDFAASMTQQVDGKILVAGWAATATGDDFAM